MGATNRNSLKKALIILLIVAFFAFADNLFFNNFIKNTGLKVLDGPMQKLNQKLTAKSATFKSLTEFKSLSEENKKLEEQNLDLTSKVAELETLKRENEFLKSQLGLGLEEKGELLSAKIVSIDKTPLYSVMTINKGRKNGIERNMAVISSSSILAGVVDEVFNDFSTVLLLDDSRLSISVRQGSSEVLSSTKGISDGKFLLDLIAAEEEIILDEVIYSSGLDELPEGLPAGKVSSVEIETGDAFQLVKVEMFFDFSSGPNVFVIIP